MIEIALSALALIAPAQTVVIDTTHTKPISPYVYGTNFPDWQKLGTPFPIARLGGNRTTAYNWENNASNAGNDWHFQSDDYMGKTAVPGKTYVDFMRDAQTHGAIPLLTIPTAGYVAADKGPEGDVRQTPNYLEARFNRSLATKPGKRVYPPNTKDRVVYEDEFVAYLQRSKSSRTPVWYALDNEPDLWGSTHQEIWKKNPTYAQILENNIEYASAIKSVAPKSLIFGPANYGWQGFRTFQDAPDRKGRDFLDFYLSGMKAAGQRERRRLLDVLDIHWYPEAQGGGVRITTNQDKPGTAEARIQAPRSLWDPTYVEKSWIALTLGGKPIHLLPRVTGQIQRNYPATKLAITEYNYGGGRNASGMVAQADVLGIFGRYGLFAACNWGLSPNDPAQLAAFRAFLNYDGRGSRFGDLGLKVTGETADSNSVYAALDSRHPRRLTVVAINKTDFETPMTLSLRGFSGKKALAYTAVYDRPMTPRPTTASIVRGAVRFEAPPLSVTTIEVRG